MISYGTKLQFKFILVKVWFVRKVDKNAYPQDELSSLPYKLR